MVASLDYQFVDTWGVRCQLHHVFPDVQGRFGLYQSRAPIPNNLSLLMNLLPFVLLLGLLFLLVGVLHQRSILSLTTSRDKVDYNQVLILFWVNCPVDLSQFLRFRMPWTTFHRFMEFQSGEICPFVRHQPIVVRFQIGFEEYLFRGYLMQQIGIIAKNRWFPLLLTSTLFGLFHSANPEVAKMGCRSWCFT